MAVAANTRIKDIDQAEDRRVVRDLARELRARPGDVALRGQLAAGLMQLQRYRDAIDELEDIVDEEGATINDRVMLAECLYLNGDFQDSLEQTEEILDAHPNHARARIIAAAAHRALSDMRFEECVVRDAAMGVFTEVVLNYYDGRVA